MQPDINQFVYQALEKKMPRSDIRSALEKAGWPKEEIDSALAGYAEVDFPIPVPKRKPYLSAREAFMYLVLFTTLYLSAYNFGALIFNFINRAFPDPLRQFENFSSDGVRFSIAALVIAFPIFLWLSSVLTKAITKDPAKRGSKVRKWLSYLTLFIAAGVIIGDLIALIFQMLGGELTARFGLKVLTVLVIAGLIFGYYLWDLKQDEKEA